MSPDDLKITADIAAKAANIAVNGHEQAQHTEPLPEKDLGPVVIGATGIANPAGFLQDGNGNNSSKRLESFLGFGVAAAVAILGVIFVPTHLVEVGAVAGAFLTYSLAMQGVSASSEKNLPV